MLQIKQKFCFVYLSRNIVLLKTLGTCEGGGRKRKRGMRKKRINLILF